MGGVNEAFCNLCRKRTLWQSYAVRACHLVIDAASGKENQVKVEYDDHGLVGEEDFEDIGLNL